MTRCPAHRAAFVLAACCTALSAAHATDAVNSRNDYMLQCQGCHKADGSGSRGSVPDLRDRVGLFVRVEGGREYLVGVPGSAQSPLSDLELAEVLNWMIREFGPADVSRSFAPFTASEVEQQRAPLVDVEAVRGALLRKLASGSPEGGRSDGPAPSRRR